MCAAVASAASAFALSPLSNKFEMLSGHSSHTACVPRAQHKGISLAGQGEIVLEAAVAAEETLVLEAPHRLPDSELAHDRHLQMSLRGAQRRSNLDRAAHRRQEIASLRSR